MRRAYWIGVCAVVVVLAGFAGRIASLRDSGERNVWLIVATVMAAELAMLMRREVGRLGAHRLWRRHVVAQLLDNHRHIQDCMAEWGRRGDGSSYSSGQARFSMWDLARDEYLALCHNPSEAAAMQYLVDAQRACATAHPDRLEWHLGFDKTVDNNRWRISKELERHHNSARLALQRLGPFLDASQRRIVAEYEGQAKLWPNGWDEKGPFHEPRPGQKLSLRES